MLKDLATKRVAANGTVLREYPMTEHTTMGGVRYKKYQLKEFIEDGRNVYLGVRYDVYAQSWGGVLEHDAIIEPIDFRSVDFVIERLASKVGKGRFWVTVTDLQTR